jgi:hypothetical protein
VHGRILGDIDDKVKFTFSENFVMIEPMKLVPKKNAQKKPLP